jgi:hypothetical protein
MPVRTESTTGWPQRTLSTPRSASGSWNRGLLPVDENPLNVRRSPTCDAKARYNLFNRAKTLVVSAGDHPAGLNCE